MGILDRSFEPRATALGVAEALPWFVEEVPVEERPEEGVARSLRNWELFMP